jgi:hypothetical protein
MPLNAEARLTRLQGRRLDPSQRVREAREVYKRLTETPAIKYAIGAMQPIDEEYTAKTLTESDRVQAQLDGGYKGAGLDVSFEHQGSVTNDTHIKAHSDIDLLSIEGRFHYVEPPNTAQPPYAGDAIADLRAIRASAVRSLTTNFPAATVDTSGSKSVSIQGGSLARKVDVVVCAPWYTVDFVADRTQAHYRGIYVLDNQAGSVVGNKPFLHNKRLDTEDIASFGGLRKLVRLLKSLKADSDQPPDISSYDIAALVYNMPTAQRLSMPGGDLLLVRNCRDYLRSVRDSDASRALLMVPNGMRRVFTTGGASLQGLQGLAREAEELVEDIEAGLTRSFRKLAEARVSY